jgi:aryl-alcohol dehydrogenase-like predicted oxidoreductase
MLSGKYEQGETPAADSRYGRGRRLQMAGRVLTDRNFAVVDEVRAMAQELATTPSAVSIAWCLTRRGITSVMIGPRTHEQQEECLAGFDLALPEELVKRLSDASRPER